MEFEENKIYRGEASEVLGEFPDDSIDLVVTSPPYNVGVNYSEYDDSINMNDYKSMIKNVFVELDQVVKNSGRVCVNVSLKNDGEIVNIPSLIRDMGEKLYWDLRFEIIWNKGSSEASSAWGSWRSPSSPRPIFNHEYILVFDVGDEKRDYMKSMKKDRFMQLVKSVWDVNPETSSDHPAPFPKEIPRRLIELNSYEGDVVLDPFVGSGTTAIVSEQMNRDWVGIDVDQEYVDMSYDRIGEESTKIFDERSIFDY